ncbi:MAG: CopG family transcriptional regulator [Candidatus Eisenbacteria bacterium]|nr:CopG family transcriptional regulator [Candidatus Eisenbacteria bacterium]
MGNSPKRATVYFDPQLHRALRLLAAETDRSISDLVNDAVRRSLSEDAEDLAALRDRGGEPRISFESAVRDLKRRGKV